MVALIRNVQKYPLFSFFLHSRFTSTLFLATIVGIGTGFAVVGFIKLIDFCRFLFFEVGARLLFALKHYYVIVIPAIGALSVAPLVICVSEAKGHGVPEVMKAIAIRGGKIRPLVVVVKSLASAIAIGSGASVGREGPIVQVGSALGSTIGQWFRQNEARLKNLIACGAASGIAGVFNAPIAGVMFALEVILRDFGARALSSVVIAAVCSSIISRIYLGDSPAFVAPAYSLTSPYEIFLYFVLGIVSGLVALLFVFALYFTEDGFESLKLPNWLKLALGGLLLGGIGFFFPQVFGTGFETIEDALYGKLAFQILAILIFLKIVAVSLTLGSGNSGGVFAPALFIGAVTGGAYGRLLFHRLPFPTAPPGAYALVGMASVFAGAAHAPVTAILIVFEMTGDYKIILPLMISTVVATVLSQTLNRESIYTTKLKRSGIDTDVLEESKMFAGLLVKDAMDQGFKLIPSNCPVRKVAEDISKHRDKSFIVTDQLGRPTGEIALDDLESVLAELANPAVLADDLSQPLRATCFPDDPLTTVASAFLSENLAHVVVLDPFDQTRIAGVLRRENVFKTYAQAASHREELMQRMAAPELVQGGELKEIHFQVSKTSCVVGKEVRHLGLPEGAMLISIRRGRRRAIPRGNTVLRERDRVYAVIAPEQRPLFQKWLEENRISPS